MDYDSENFLIPKILFQDEFIVNCHLMTFLCTQS